MRRLLLACGLLAAPLLAAAGCVQPSCPQVEPGSLVAGVYEGSLTAGESASINGYPVTGPVEVEIDAEAGRVIVRFDSEGRAVEQAFDVARTEDGYF